MSIPFTQYLRPNGRREAVTIDMHTTIEEQAQELISAGYVFEIEELMNRVIHMDCSRPQDAMPVALELCENGPPVVQAVQDLVLEAHSYAFPPEVTND